MPLLVAKLSTGNMKTPFQLTFDFDWLKYFKEFFGAIKLFG